MKTRTYLVLSLLAVLAGGGCDVAAPKRRNASGAIGGAGLVAPDAAVSSQAPKQQPVAVPVSPAGVASPGAPVSPGGTAAPAGEAHASAPPAGVSPAAAPASLPGAPGTAPATTGTVTEKAAPGVTGKGNYKPGIITTPISVYFRVQERLIFDNVTYAIKLYEAEHGFKPKTHEAFMKEIIEANQPALKLPKLPEGHTYKYDPQKGELMVEHPE